MDAFADFVESINEGECGRILIVHGDIVGCHVSLPQLRELVGDGRMVGVLCLLDRPGYGYFQRWLEMTHFPPLSEDEPLLVCLILRWRMLWGITLVPRAWKRPDGSTHRGLPLLREGIERSGLRVAAAVPMIFEGSASLDAVTIPSGHAGAFAAGGIELDLPMQNLLYVENVPGHLVYTDPTAAYAEEHRRLKELPSYVPAQKGRGQ